MMMKLDPVYPEIVARMTYFKDKTRTAILLTSPRSKQSMNIMTF